MAGLTTGIAERIESKLGQAAGLTCKYSNVCIIKLGDWSRFGKNLGIGAISTATGYAGGYAGGAAIGTAIFHHFQNE
jgi:hypothetical protein